MKKNEIYFLYIFINKTTYYNNIKYLSSYCEKLL
jgi:hypothetical protein